MRRRAPASSVGRAIDPTAIRALLEKALEESPAKAETLRGKVTDDFILDCAPDPNYSKLPAPKKKKPHRSVHRVPGVAFEEAQKRTDSKKKKRSKGKRR